MWREDIVYFCRVSWEFVLCHYQKVFILEYKCIDNFPTYVFHKQILWVALTLEDA